MQPFVTFDISKGAVTSRLLKNKFFGILTLGFYRFWGKTHLRRLFWQSIKVGGERLQYHGTAKELFIGFLIAMVLLTVLFGVLGVALGFLALSGPTYDILGQVINFLFLYGFWQFARYRLWRYRSSRTSLRTIRFFLKGKALTYTGKAMLWTVITILTLGWAYPRLLAVRADYMLNNMAYGDQGFRFTGNATGFFRIYWPAILLTQCIVVVLYVYVTLVLGFNLDGMMQTEEAFAQAMLDPVTQTILYSGMAISFFLFLIARVQSFRYIVGQTGLGSAVFASSLHVGRVLLIMVLMTLVGILGIAVIVGLIVAAATLEPQTVVFMSIGAFVLVYLVFDILMYLFLIVPLLRAITSTMTISDPEIFEQVARTSQDSPTYGEGLADALDVGAF